MPIYTLCHRTSYQYTSKVASSVNHARLRPRDLPGQRLMNFEIEASPTVTGYQEDVDSFGNATLFFQVNEPHKRFEICAKSKVDISWSHQEEPPESLPWEEVADLLREPNSLELQDALQFALESPMVRPFPDLEIYARSSFPPGKPIAEGAFHLMRRIKRDFRFLPGSTSLKTTLEMVFQTRCGVCQDFTHLMLGCLRSLGLAARYVSGYLETDTLPGKPKLVGVDASHAWVSVFLPGKGWLDFDPTNNVLPGPRHITLAWGRDFSDISPLRGVIYGGGTQTLKVEVDVVREGHAAA